MHKNFIGVFDSGFGGLSTLKVLLEKFPKENFKYFGDSKNAPYGVKKDDEILDLCSNIVDNFIRDGAKSIVIACNTATAACLEELNKKYEIDIYGIAPPLKSACDYEETKTLVVMATQSTLNSVKYNQKKIEYLKNDGLNIIDMPMPEFVIMVEKNEISYENVAKLLDKKLSQTLLKEIDSIILGCTHFIFLKEYIEKYFEKRGIKINFFDGNDNLIKELSEKYEILKDEYELKEENIDNKGNKYLGYSNLIQIDNSKEELVDIMEKLIYKKDDFPFYKLENINKSIFDFIENNKLSQLQRELIDLKYFKKDSKINYRALSRKYMKNTQFIKDELDKMQKAIYKHMSKKL